MITLTSSVQKIRKLVSRFRLNYLYWVVEDVSKGFAIVGDPGGKHPYQELFLKDAPSTRSVIYRGGCKVATLLASQYGMSVISGKNLSEELLAQTVRVANFTALELQLPATLEAYKATLGHSARDDIRRIRNAGYTFQISRDSSWCNEFFHRYHSPAIGRRYGVAGYIMSTGHMVDLITNEEGHFLKIFSEEECIGAAMFQVKSGCLHILRLGWLDGNEQLYRGGVVAAIYWFCIQQAYSMNCQEINFGGTPSYLENGVLKFKSKWGAVLSNKYTKLSSRFLLLNPSHPDCQAFLQNYSLILLGEDNSFSVLSSKYPGKAVLTESLMKSVKDWYVLRSECVDNEGFLSRYLPEQLSGWYEKISVNEVVEV